MKFAFAKFLARISVWKLLTLKTGGSPLDNGRRFKNKSITLKMEAVSFSEASASIYHATGRKVLEDSHLRIRHRGRLKI